MRKVTVVLAAALVIAGCGKGAATSPQAKADEKKAEAVVKRCLPSGDFKSLIYSKSARHTFVRCAFPPKNRVAAEHCVVDGVLGHIPTVHRVESVVLGCAGRYE